MIEIISRYRFGIIGLYWLVMLPQMVLLAYCYIWIKSDNFCFKISNWTWNVTIANSTEKHSLLYSQLRISTTLYIINTLHLSYIDNLPFTRIFQQNAKLSAIISVRLLRYASFYWVGLITIYNSEKEKKTKLLIVSQEHY